MDKEVRWTTLEVLKHLRKHTVSSYLREVDHAIAEHEQLQAETKRLKEEIKQWVKAFGLAVNALQKNKLLDDFKQALKGGKDD